MLEKGWIGGGNVGRNTTIIRSNYLLPGNIPLYELSMKLWEGLEQELNYNAMVSQRGVLNLYHSDAQRDAYARRGNAMRLHGVDAELLDRERRPQAAVPSSISIRRGFRSRAACCRRRGGTARHDAVAWGYARGASDRGVDIIQNCEVTGFSIDGRPRHRRRDHARHDRARSKVGIAVAGNSSRVAAMAGLRLPIESHVLQAFVSEGLKPVIPGVITFGAGHFYISQSDKGGLVFGGDIDGYNSYAQRGNLPTSRTCCEGGMALMPAIGRARMLRSWGGIVDMSMDGSPIIDRTPIHGLYLNAGWCYGGFKATPGSGWCFAHLIARDEPHEAADALPARSLRAAAISSTKRARAPNPICIEARHENSTAPIADRATPHEFSYRGDADAAAPEPAGEPQRMPRRMFDYVYLRDNPAGRHREHWYHGAGCRSWLVVTRDTATHEILGVGLCAAGRRLR